MSQQINDNFDIKAGKSVDDKYGKIVGGKTVPYASTTEANAAININYRYIGLTVLIQGENAEEYWYHADVTDESLVAKSVSQSLATVATSGEYSDLLGLPTIPNVPTDVSAFTNDSGYITSAVTRLTGITNQVSVSAPTGSVIIYLPQDIAETSSPLFAGMELNGSFNSAGNKQGLKIDPTLTNVGAGESLAGIVVNPTFNMPTPINTSEGVTIITTSNDYTTGSHNGCTATGGTGTGATFSVSIASDHTISNIFVTNGGDGYQVGDVLTLVGSYGGTLSIVVSVPAVGFNGVSAVGIDIQSGYLKINGSILYTANNSITFGQGNSSAGTRNIFLGVQSGTLNSGSYNTAVGFGSILGHDSGSYNTAVGDHGGFSIGAGSYNTALGYSAIGAATIGVPQLPGDNNTGVGAFALSIIGAGATLNTALGFNAGANLISGQSNIIIGNNIDVADPNGNNQLAIGSGGTTWIGGTGGAIQIPNLAGSGSRVVVADASGNLTATQQLSNMFVTDADIVAAITGATYNSGNNFTAAITPASLKVFNQGFWYKDPASAFLYYAVANNASFRITGS